MFCKRCFFWSVLSVEFSEAILTCLKAGACVSKHITNASHSDTKGIRGNERQGNESGLLPWQGSSLVLLGGLQMNRETKQNH